MLHCDFTCLLHFYRKQKGSFAPGQWPFKETISGEVALGDIDQGNMRVIPNPLTKEIHGTYMCTRYAMYLCNYYFSNNFRKLKVKLTLCTPQCFGGML